MLSIGAAFFNWIVIFFLNLKPNLKWLEKMNVSFQNIFSQNFLVVRKIHVFKADKCINLKRPAKLGGPNLWLFAFLFSSACFPELRMRFCFPFKSWIATCFHDLQTFIIFIPTPKTKNQETLRLSSWWHHMKFSHADSVPCAWCLCLRRDNSNPALGAHSLSYILAAEGVFC